MARSAHRQGNPDGWYAARVDELHAITRRIHAIEDEQVIEERRHATPLRAYTVQLGREAQRVMDRFHAEYRLEPEFFLRYVVENFLVDADDDNAVLICAVESARLIEETGCTRHLWEAACEQEAA